MEADEALIGGEPSSSRSYRYIYYPHNVHFVLVSARMAGDARRRRSAPPTSWRGSSRARSRWRSPAVQAIQQAPYFAHAQFSPPATVLALPDPGAEFPFVQGSWRYARAMAQIRGGRPAGRGRGAAAGWASSPDGSDFSELAAWFVPAKEVLTIAGKVVDGQMARAAGDHAQAEAALREAAAIAGRPALHGAALLVLPRAPDPGRRAAGGWPPAEAATREFQASLHDAPNNAFALYGLMLAQEAAGDAAGAKATRALFDRAWAGGTELPQLAVYSSSARAGRSGPGAICARWSARRPGWRRGWRGPGTGCRRRLASWAR